MKNSKQTYYVLSDKEDIEQEAYFFSQVLKPYRKEIAEIKEAYKLILEIITKFKETYPFDPKLSVFYNNLFELIEKNIEIIKDEINLKYYSSEKDSLSDDFISTDIYNKFYKPFPNLYEERVGDLKSEEWTAIQERLNICYAQIDDAYQKYALGKVKQLPNQRLFIEVYGYLKSKEQSLKTTKINDKQYALRLSLKGDRFYITGTAINNNEITLLKLRKSTSSLLLESTIKSCANKPMEFKNITEEMLRSKSRYGIDDLTKAIKKVKVFKQYISNIGLKGKLKGLFYGNSSSDLGYRFRTAVSKEEWNSLKNTEKNEVLEYLSIENKKGVVKKTKKAS